MLIKFAKFLLVIGMLITTGVAQAADLKVTILVFSGYTNPSYIFPSDSIPQLVELFKKAYVDNTIPMDLPTTLQYHGIVVDNPGSLGDLPQRVFLYKGRIEVEKTGGGKEILVDKDRGVEELLFGKARELGIIGERVINFIETGEIN